MPPKKRNVASKVALELEESNNEIPKKRGKKFETTAIEAANEGASTKSEMKQKKTVVKPETKSDKTIKTAEEKTERKTKAKVTTKSEEPIEKKPTRKKAEKEDDKKEKPMAKNKKPGPSGDKPEDKETKTAKPTKSKATQTKTTKKTTKATPKAEGKPALLNVSETKWDEIDFGCKRQNPKGYDFNLKITSWNVDGIRAWLKKGGFSILEYDNPDILCLQETKCSDDKLPNEVTGVEGYSDYWCSSDKEGYAGVGVYTKKEPLNIKDGIDDENHDNEGRCLTLEFTDFYLVNVYVPNAGRGLVTLGKRLEWNESFNTYIEELDSRKPVILCGDMNVAHNEIDLANPKSNKKNAGFTQEERDGMTDFLAGGFVDSFRHLYPEQTDIYTFWSYMTKARSKNIGWRLDYFILSERIMDNVCDNVVRTEVYGSDHCPITLFIKL